MPLPRLRVRYPWHHLNAKAEWVSEEIEVEVVSLHLRTGRMRVRSVEKINQSPEMRGGGAQIQSWDLSSDEFFVQYSLVPKKPRQHPDLTWVP